jgi:Ca2+-binding EF-hand superfamily protein
LNARNIAKQVALEREEDMIQRERALVDQERTAVERERNILDRERHLLLEEQRNFFMWNGNGISESRSEFGRVTQQNALGSTANATYTTTSSAPPLITPIKLRTPHHHQKQHDESLVETVKPHLVAVSNRNANASGKVVHEFEEDREGSFALIARGNYSSQSRSRQRDLYQPSEQEKSDLVEALRMAQKQIHELKRDSLLGSKHLQNTTTKSVGPNRSQLTQNKVLSAASPAVVVPRLAVADTKHKQDGEDGVDGKDLNKASGKEIAQENYDKDVVKKDTTNTIDDDSTAPNNTRNINSASTNTTQSKPAKPQNTDADADAQFEQMRERHQRIMQVRPQLQAVFKHTDKDNSGAINVRELLIALRKDTELQHLLHLPSHIRQEDGTRVAFERVFQAIDIDMDREITFEEFENYIFNHVDVDDEEGVNEEVHGVEVNEEKKEPTHDCNGSSAEAEKEQLEEQRKRQLLHRSMKNVLDHLRVGDLGEKSKLKWIDGELMETEVGYGS